MRFKKYINEAAGKFSYASQIHAEDHRTLESLIKTNNGIFKSTKQRWFLLEKKWKYDRQIGGGKDPIFRSPADVKKLRNISEIKKGEYLVEVNAHMIFGGGAKQGTRRIEWGYVVDDVGVREKYKYGFIYHRGGHSSEMDLKKTKREWKRKDTEEVEAFREEVAREEADRKEKTAAAETEQLKSNYIGVVGKRVKDIKIDVIRKHFFQTQYGQSAITVMKDTNGNVIQHFGKNTLKKGDKGKVIDFTVKAHEKAEINKWNSVPYKFTSVTRVKVK